MMEEGVLNTDGLFQVSFFSPRKMRFELVILACLVGSLAGFSDEYTKSDFEHRMLDLQNAMRMIKGVGLKSFVSTSPKFFKKLKKMPVEIMLSANHGNSHNIKFDPIR